MVRILVTSSPMPAHVRPTVPIVRELVGAGHHVVWYTGPEFRSLVTGTGAEFAPSSVQLDVEAALRAGAGRRGLARLNKLVLEVFLKPIPAYLADLADLADRVDPDVVVADHSFRAGMFLAEQRGIPRVAFSVGPLNLSSVATAPFGTGRPPATSAPGRLRNRARHWAVRNVFSREPQRAARRIRRAAGLRPLRGFFIDWVSMVADRYLEATVPEFEYPRPDLRPTVRFVGAMLETGVDDWTPPAWWPDVEAARRAGRPVVFLTQGSITTDPTNLILPAISALRSEDVLLVATTSGRDPQELLPAGERPQMLRLASFIPYTEMLPLTDLMITNGGYGGVQTALSHGVPLVVSGTSEDKKETNARVAWCGAGVSLSTDTPEPAALAAAARTVLADPSYRAHAQRLKDAYGRYCAPQLAAAAVLEVAIRKPARDGRRAGR